MSSSGKFMYSVDEALRKHRKAGGTRTAIRQTLSLFDRSMRKRNIGLTKVKQISGRHFVLFIDERIAAGDDPGTLQNKASHIRTVLKHGGKPELARDKTFTNKKLRIPPRTREGTKKPMTPSALVSFLNRALQLRRPGFGHLANLEITMGLRGNEALHGDQRQILKWIHEIEEFGAATIERGTKNGRPRISRVLNKNAALTVLRAALAYLRRIRSRFLVTRADGKRCKSLREATSIYRSFMNRAGITPHACRYSYALALLWMYRKQGLTPQHALANVALMLGHGAGRGRWAKHVYCRMYDELAPTGLLEELATLIVEDAAKTGLPMPRLSPK